ncbi:MAG: GNAT family N-acetyltransferase [Hyphomicrobium sp.]
MITLRPASPSRAAVTLADMTQAAAAELAPSLTAITPWATYAMSSEAMRTYLAAHEPGAPRYQLRLGDQLAGAVGLRLNWMRGPYMQQFGIVPAFQRQGLGDLVLAWFEADAKERGDRSIWVAASDFNADAIRFYERFGFQRTADLADLLRDGVTEILFRKKIA